MNKVIHFYADSEGDMSECGRGFFADVGFENGTSKIEDVTCKQCLSLYDKRVKDLQGWIDRNVKTFSHE